MKLNPYFIGFYMLHVIRYDIMKKLYVPDSCYNFPFHHDYGKQRRFSYTWLKDYKPWLVYSKVLDGGLYLPCLLFVRLLANVPDMGDFVSCKNGTTREAISH